MPARCLAWRCPEGADPKMPLGWLGALVPETWPPVRSPLISNPRGLGALGAVCPHPGQTGVAEKGQHLPGLAV